MDASGYLKQIEAALEGGDYGIIGVSADFVLTSGIRGRVLETKYYEVICNMIKEGSQKSLKGVLRSWKAATILTWHYT